MNIIFRIVVIICFIIGLVYVSSESFRAIAGMIGNYSVDGWELNMTEINNTELNFTVNETQPAKNITFVLIDRRDVIQIIE